MTVWIYADPGKEVGDKDRFKVFASELAANRWFEDNDPIGVAVECEVIEWSPFRSERPRRTPADD